MQIQGDPITWLVLLIAIPTWVLLVAGAMLNADPLKPNDYGEKR